MIRISFKRIAFTVWRRMLFQPLNALSQIVIFSLQFTDGLQHQIRKLAVIHAFVARLVG